MGWQWHQLGDMQIICTLQHCKRCRILQLSILVDSLPEIGRRVALSVPAKLVPETGTGFLIPISGMKPAPETGPRHVSLALDYLQTY